MHILLSTLATLSTFVSLCESVKKPGQRVCIIGAGPSGLTACKEMLAAGLEPTLFEQTDQVGGNWVYREETSHSSVYNCTRIDNSKHILAFSDFPPPSDFPHFCSHRLILAYLNQYVDHFGFRGRIAFNTRVESCSPVGTTGWRVVTSSNGTRQEHDFDALLVCNGHHNVPRTPREFTETAFKGQLLHSHSYKRPDPFKKKKVVVIGVGNSGVDIACDVSHEAEMVYLSTRSGAYVLPKMVGSKPIDFALTQLSYMLPWRFLFLLSLFTILFFKVLFLTQHPEPHHEFDVLLDCGEHGRGLASPQAKGI